MMQVTLYGKKNCQLCDEALTILQILQETIPMDIEIIDIYQDDTILEKYFIEIPVVCVNGNEIAYGKILYTELEERLNNIASIE